MRRPRLPIRGQGSLEYILLVMAAILLAIIVLAIVLQTSGKGDSIIGNFLDDYSDSTQNAAFGNDSTEGNNAAPVCPNGVLESGEICDSDTISCLVSGYPGTQTCNSSCTNYEPCTTSLFCGDHTCNGSETPASCSQDCSLAAFCGNAICDAGENPLTCVGDCSLSISPKELWMHPNHYTTHGGPSLTDSETGWDTTLNNIDVFGVYGGNLGSGPAFSLPLLKQKGVRINVEVGALRSFQCDGTTFFNNIDSVIFDQLVAGGHDDFVASMDNPFTYTVKDGFWSQCAVAYENFTAGTGPDPVTLGCGPQAPPCEYSIDQVSDELVEYLALFRTRYPNASIGWIESQPLFEYDTYGAAPPVIVGKKYPDFKKIIDSFTSKITQYNSTHPSNQISLRFFHADSYATGMVALQPFFNTWEKQKAMGSYLQSKGIRFGILLNDYADLPIATPAEKDQFFAEHTLEYYDCWLAKGGTLDDIVVESWVGDYPTSTSPEEQANTFTHVMYELIDRLSDPTYVPLCTLP